MGDQVAPRRHVASVVASGETAVRNRHTWRVTAIGDDGSLSVEDPRRHGRLKPAVDYQMVSARLDSRMAPSRVTKGSASALAVATMNRSHGSVRSIRGIRVKASAYKSEGLLHDGPCQAPVPG